VGRAGFTITAASIALEMLKRRKMLSSARITTEHENYFYPGYRLEQAGLDWLISNQGILNLRAIRATGEQVVPVDDIPF
jgi:hypothetical protein